MKRILCAVCALMLVYAASGCTENSDSSSGDKSSSESSSESRSEGRYYSRALELYSWGEYEMAQTLLLRITEDDPDYDNAQELLKDIEKRLAETRKDPAPDDSSSHSEPTVVSPSVISDDIEPISDGENSELVWMSYYDLNPVNNLSEKRTELQLFEQKGGSISYKRTTFDKKYDELAAAILTGDAPDMFVEDNNLQFPMGTVKGFFQPVDEVVDFSAPMWADMRNAADQFMINNKHYAAPINLTLSAVMVYDKSKIEGAGLDDPYELYQNGQWNWDSWLEIMESYCAENKDAVGINGYFAPMIFNSTGHSIVEFDRSKNAYVNNIDDSSLERAAALLREINEKGLYTYEWFGSTEDAMKHNILFYAMGTWASSGQHTPDAEDEWAMVPVPADPASDKHYQTANIESYLWVTGSEKKDAFRCWLECARAVHFDDDLKAAEKERFMEQNPFWTEQMYSVAFPDEAEFIIDNYYGYTTLLSDNSAADNDNKEALLEMLYRAPLTDDAPEWAKLKKEYSPVIDEELSQLNAGIKALK